MLARIRHEIRSPMTALVGMAEIRRHDGVTPEQGWQLKALHDAAQHLLSIVNDVLDLSRINHGESVLE